jgi:hypothetical protein
MPKKNTVAINLLSSTTFEASPIGQVISWILTAGKAIVFVAFLIVIGAFIYRFSLDRRSQNLLDSITENVDTIQQYSTTENDIRSFQNKLEVLGSLMLKDQRMYPIMANFEQSLPVKIHLDSLAFTPNALSFQGEAPNEAIFTNMLESLKRQTEFSEIIIDKLQSGGIQDPKIIFSIMVTINKPDNKSTS